MLRHICCRMSKPFTVVIILAYLCSLAVGVILVTEDRNSDSSTSTSVDPDSADCEKVFLLIATGSGSFTYEFTSGNTNSAFSIETDTNSGDEKITCDTALLISNSLTSYTLVVTLTDTSDSSTTEETLTVAVTLPTLGKSCTDNTGCTEASGEVCETVCKLGHGADCASNTGSCVSHAICSGTTCSCDSGYLDDGSKLCKADLDTTCSADADCDTSTNAGAVCDTNASPNACKLGVGADCSVKDKCVINGACENSACSCVSDFTAQSNLCTAQSSSGVTTLTCYHCSLGTNCDKDDVTGSTQSSTSGSDNCVYCYIAWNDTHVVRGCLSSTTAASYNINRSGCADGWSEGLYGTGCACQTALCNETPEMAGYSNTATQLNDFMTHLLLTFVTLCVFCFGI
ncbi:multiple epidermal growth factor-like domains protein 10 isoform X2 [Mya arenaria]|nr:multiple epidermal growth factor-like domains protein 10 isoform X2 [Mya arenaria]XP_052771849.1 multiple epidermal growth factor-like domains protein 10 isoform X2 [Mya arenaria]XP_052771850.1 multiple epidermal growth factor-like domains protein 10 isoform X2 [Mya arenaria]XP_052771851.1 multiple epidermal growth factor-like domains protein 10 isoform X2 [Mya arenaria]XP_052771852.1 multiple epidermal growth factor-like domains protein 10 isoform X2 [Mya arenaria]